MKRRWITSLCALVLLGGAPLAAETIIGTFDAAGNVGHGVMELNGWALATSGVSRVIIQVDGEDFASVPYGDRSPSVERDYPGFVDAANANFTYQFNTTEFDNGLHWLKLKVQTLAGGSHVVASRDFFFTNSISTLPPFGRIDLPERNAQLFGNCGPELPGQGRRFSLVTGFAVDVGMEIGDAGVGYVELLVDGSIIANTRLAAEPSESGFENGCFFDPVTSQLYNCYGFPRLDVEREFPFTIDALNAGFRFGLDVGRMLQNGYARGHHTLTIRSGDISGQVANIDEIPVTFFCTGDLGNEPTYGQIESPHPRRSYADLIRFEGWAVDWEGIREVQIFVDGVYIRNARLNQGIRTLVEIDFPGFPGTDFPVWRAFVDSTRFFSEGEHQAQIIAFDNEGDATVIGETTFFVDNEDP